MKVQFVTPTKISLIDITSMGDSAKRGDTATIGQFDSGLKYAIAILLRNNVSMSICVQGDPVLHDTYNEPATLQYTFSTFIQECDQTDKKKELIKVDCEYIPHGGQCMSPHDMREPSGGDSWEVQTGFAKALGYNWELWMALRELYSNMIDEGGEISTWDMSEEIAGTVITLEFDPDSEFGEIWKNKHLYINESLPIYTISDSVEALRNNEGYLRIYKQNILVYKDEAVPSRYAYNIKFGEIDERRILTNIHGVASSIVSAIMYSQNTNFLRAIIMPEIKFEPKEFLTGYDWYSTAEDLVHDICFDIYSEHGKVESYTWLLAAVKRRKDCKIGGKVIRSVQDHLYSYSNNVTVETAPADFAEPPMQVDDVQYIDPFSAEIKKIYNFDLDVQVKKAKLKGSKVIADKYNKCIIIDDTFDIVNDMPAFIVQYIDLTQTGNLLVNLSEYICRLIKK